MVGHGPPRVAGGRWWSVKCTSNRAVISRAGAVLNVCGSGPDESGCSYIVFPADQELPGLTITKYQSSTMRKYASLFYSVNQFVHVVRGLLAGILHLLQICFASQNILYLAQISTIHAFSEHLLSVYHGGLLSLL